LKDKITFQVASVKKKIIIKNENKQEKAIVSNIEEKKSSS
jgi:hypothetical protein